ncbi:MAG TPA: CheR family methyltransferase [Streptosporangiaceae bacterium]|nr:CheR family methyltransferase [Streptosporangiaceae bacterium]
MRQETGLALPAARQEALRAALQRVAPGTTEDGLLQALSDPARTRPLLDRLIDEVTVRETFFARDMEQLRAIPWASLRAWRAAHGAGGPVRAWSAGCATGEEACTLALEAARALGPEPGQVQVLGTDISPAALAGAAAGCYSERSVRHLAPDVRGQFLARQPDGRYRAGGPLRELVRFRRHNLALDPVPPPDEAPFDVVVCRNVLIYLDTQLIGRVIAGLERALRPGGMLVLGAADVLHRSAARHVPGGPPARHRQAGAPGGGRNGRHREPDGSLRERLTAALTAADAGNRAGALAAVTRILAIAPGDAEAQFVYGLIALEGGDLAGAARALRRALDGDPTLGLAAFALGRACDRLGDAQGARAAYARALRTLDPADQRHELLLQQVDIRDIAAACRARLGGAP